MARRRRSGASGASGDRRRPPPSRLQRSLRWFDDRVGGARFGRGALDKVFPTHWSFLLGEITLYSFIVLVVTGVYLTFFFEPSTREVVYQGPYEPLQGVEMSAAYASGLRLSFEVRAGLVMRQMHHWAALVFVAATLVHMMRVFFTGAYRRPRELNWVIGVTLMILAIVNGFLGYSLLDDLLSGTGLRVAWSILLSVPFVGPALGFAVFGGEFPSPETIPRFYTLHVLVVPAIIGLLLAAHLALVWRQKHTQFPGKGRTEENVVGARLWPGFAMKSVGLLFVTAAVLAALGGLAQINPIWVYGPFRTAVAASAATSASQPDWYMGWLDGALRLMPGWEFRSFGFTIANPFFPGVVVPTIVFGLLYAWPWIEHRFRGDDAAHHLLERPRDAPVRTAIGCAGLAWYAVLFVAGSNDVIAATFEVTPESVTALFRILLFVLPAVVFVVVRKVCRDLKASEARPLRGLPAARLARRGERVVEVVERDGDRADAHTTADEPLEPATRGRDG